MNGEWGTENGNREQGTGNGAVQGMIQSPTPPRLSGSGVRELFPGFRVGTVGAAAGGFITADRSSICDGYSRPP